MNHCSTDTQRGILEAGLAPAVPGHLSEPDNTRAANRVQYCKKVFVPFLMSYVLYLSHLLHHASDHQINLDKCNFQM